MFSKKALLFIAVMVLLGLVAACGAQPEPQTIIETVIVEKEVEGETVTVVETVVVEKGVLGGQVALTPVVENYPGMKEVGGKTLVDIMVTHALEYVDIFPGEEVVDIIPGEPHVVQTSRRKFKTQAVLLASGASHRHLGVPGEQRFSGRGVSYCATCDGPLFKGKTVYMVGGGNSAVTEALHLHNMGVAVTLVHRRDRLKAQEVLVKQLVDNQIPILSGPARSVRADRTHG